MAYANHGASVLYTHAKILIYKYFTEVLYQTNIEL